MHKIAFTTPSSAPESSEASPTPRIQSPAFAKASYGANASDSDEKSSEPGDSAFSGQSKGSFEDLSNSPPMEKAENGESSPMSAKVNELPEMGHDATLQEKLFIKYVALFSTLSLNVFESG
jgi:hypothetical protein